MLSLHREFCWLPTDLEPQSTSSFASESVATGESPTGCGALSQRSASSETPPLALAVSALPITSRKVSQDPFHEPRDEREKGNNFLSEADEDSRRINTRPVGPLTPDRGPSSLKLLPGRPTEFVYMKSVEIGGRTESWIGAASLDGTLLAEEMKIGDFKCEGIEFN